MNPLTNIRSRQRQREQEVINGVPESASYHVDYKSSAYIYAGQLSFNLTEGDLLAIFSEYGEVIDVNLVRDKQTHKSRGFAFLAYEDQRSTDIAVDNLNGVSVDGRVIAVDHVKDYKRLVDNPDYVDKNKAGDPAQQDIPDNSARARDGHRIYTGEEAEQMEIPIGDVDAINVMRNETGATQHSDDGPAIHAGESSLAAMLREVETQLGDWRNQEAAVTKHAGHRAHLSHAEDAVHNDPLARDLKHHASDSRKKSKSGKEMKRHKTKKSHKEKKSRSAVNPNSRHRSPDRSRSPRVRR